MGSHDPTLRLVRATAIGSFVLAVAFWAWFALTKSDLVGAASPFADDPFDAVGSIAVEGALAIGVLSLARAVRAPRPDDDARRRRDDRRFVLRGDLLVVGAVVATLATDGLAIRLDPGTLARGSGVAVSLIVGGMLLLAAATLAVALGLARAWHALDAAYPGLPSRSAFRPGMLRDAVTDMLRLAWLPVASLGQRVGRLGRAVAAIQARWAASGVARAALGVADRALGHPWACVAAIAAASAVLLLAAEFVIEGPPPSPAAGLLLTAIFVGVELAAALGGFLLFGAYLGLRPPVRDRPD